MRSKSRVDISQKNSEVVVRVNHKTLAEKQNEKLKKQKLKDAAKIANGNIEPKNKARFYCTNKELQQELLNWRNSDINGKIVLKLTNGKLSKTGIFETNEKHEPYEEGTRYFVKLEKPSDKDDENSYTVKLFNRAKKELEQFKQSASEPSKYDSFYENHRSWVLHEITDIVKQDGWAFNYDIVDNRILSDKLGNMVIAIGDKLLNHSSFRAYDQELKLDMRGQFFLKLIKGLKNYNFKFNNPFAFFTTCAWNSFLIIINQHYKHQNIRKNLMQKMALELQTYSGISPNNTLSRSINAYLESDRGEASND